MLPMLVEACPSFSADWEEHKRFFYDEEDYLPYVALGAFANHLVNLYRAGEVREFAKIFEVLEKFFAEGDDYVQNAANVGFIEGLQNVSGNSDLDPEVFYPFLKPTSAKMWHEMNEYWQDPVFYLNKLKDEQDQSR